MTAHATPHVVAADAVAPQPWRNGGGQTRELLAWPQANDWKVRISRADIAQDGPFSPFAQLRRWFAVLHGEGVELHFPDRVRTVRCGDDPLAFDGAPAPACRLLDGPTTDLNLMARDGDGLMQPVEPARPWLCDAPLRGLYTVCAGRWHGEGDERVLRAHSLLWATDAAGEAWRFTPEPGTLHPPAWWLAYTPAGSHR